MSCHRDAATRAVALVGTRFRPQGRDPRLGLDCLGLVLEAQGLPATAVPRDYRLRGDHRAALLSGARTHFRRVPRAEARAGDVLLLRVLADQVHLAIATERGFVHADARRGRVVETPGKPVWPLVAVLRRRARRAKGAR